MLNLMKRYSKTAAQQCRYYEVENIFEYMVSVYLNGNFCSFQKIYKELRSEVRKDFIFYCFSEVNPKYLMEIIQATI